MLEKKLELEVLLEKERQEHTVHVTALTTKHVTETKEAKEQYEEEISAQNKQHAVLLSKSEQDMYTMREEHNALLAQMRETHAEEINNKEKLHLKETSELNACFAQRILKLEEGYAESKMRIHQEHSAEVVRMQAEYDTLKSEFEEFLDSYERAAVA